MCGLNLIPPRSTPYFKRLDDISPPVYHPHKSIRSAQEDILVNNRPFVSFVSVEHIIQSTHDRHESHYKAAVVHRVGCDWRCRGPEGEKENNRQIDASENVNSRTKRLGYPPWPPDQITGTTRNVGSLQSISGFCQL